jgi:hypothetical protein
VLDRQLIKVEIGRWLAKAGHDRKGESRAGVSNFAPLDPIPVGHDAM